MTAQPLPAARTAAGEPEADAYVVSVRDAVEALITGHRGGAYTSPPQPRADALALVALLAGGSAEHDGRQRWTYPIPGGRRTITLSACGAPTATAGSAGGEPAGAERREREAGRCGTRT